MTLLNTNAATLVAAATNVDLTSAGSSAEMKSTVDTATQVAAAMAQLELELDVLLFLQQSILHIRYSGSVRILA